MIRFARRLKPRKILTFVGIFMLGGLVTFLVLRSIQSLRGVPLQLWHTYAPEEMSDKELKRADWNAYLEHEDTLMRDVRENVTLKLPEAARHPANRYHADSPIHPAGFTTDWNRSYLLMPAGEPVGAVVLLHGLTDSPYSLRHIGAFYQERGFVAVSIRLPGHGTTPGGLVRMHWETWAEATRLAIREAVRLAGSGRPLHLVGYSNGAALAINHALDAAGDRTLAKPDRLILFSPMIGVTEWARFAGVAGWPAVFPAFNKAAWQTLSPEFNPFKYQSFSVNSARQSSQLTRSIQPRLARGGGDMPPVLTFQSAVDATTSTTAVVASLFANLPEGNGSELVLFDINRSETYGPLLRGAAADAVERVLPPAPRDFAVTLITNAALSTREVVEWSTPARARSAQRRDTGLEFPRGVYSLSHVALPFPPDDPLYGIDPPDGDGFGIHLGTLAPRGERGTLIVPTATLMRMSCNPFFPLVLDKIDAAIRADL